MREFHSWIESMANSIEDASSVEKDSQGEVVIREEGLVFDGNNIQPVFGQVGSNPFKKGELTQAQKDTYENWVKRFDDEPSYSDVDYDY
jgi:hypothetical protein